MSTVKPEVGQRIWDALSGQGAYVTSINEEAQLLELVLDDGQTVQRPLP